MALLAVVIRLPRWLSVKESSGKCRLNPWVRKIPVETEMAAHSSVLAWEILWTEEPGKLYSHGVTKELNIMTKQQLWWF